MPCKMCLGQGGGGGFCQNWCIATHFHTFGPNLRTIDQRGAKVYIESKVIDRFLISTLLQKIFELKSRVWIAETALRQNFKL